MSAITMIQMTPAELGKLVEDAVRRGQQTASAKQEMDVSDVAAYLGVSTRTVRRMELRGELPARIGRLWSRSDMERFRRDRRS